MEAQQLIRDGDLDGALAALQAGVRKNAADPKLRIFLFQLLCVRGEWARALTQLNVAGELDAGALPMVQTYREAIQCEALRTEIFAGRRAPLVFGQPEPWLAQLVDALRLDAIDPQRALDARAQALEAAPASSGTLDGAPFAWLADADQRLGPVFEVILNGRYFWAPMARVASVEFDAPTDLRDTVWTAATFTWTNGASTVGLVPTRYEGTVGQAGAELLLARRTEWIAHGAGDAGVGQRMLASDNDEFALLDVRAIAFDNAPADDQAAGLAQERADG